MRAVVFSLAVSAFLSGCTQERERHPGSSPPPSQLGVPGSEPIDALPPISGGTLLITAEGSQAVVSDPDRNRVLLVDLDARDVDAEIMLPKGTHPGRAVEDGEGSVHVLLRGPGTVLTLSPEGIDRGQRAVCAAPRGIDYDADRDELVVVCVGGELVRLEPAAGGKRLSKTMLEPDLRDVVVIGAKTFVSLFRQPKVLILDAKANLTNVAVPGNGSFSGDALPTVAWRMVEWPGRGVAIAHQRSATHEIEVGADAPANAYGDIDLPLVIPAWTVIDEQGQTVESTNSQVAGVLPVDASVSESGGVAITMAGSDGVVIQNGGGLNTTSFPTPIAAQYVGESLVVQSRQPALLTVLGPLGDTHEIDLGGDDVSDIGHDIFHTQSATPLACASCHPEGRDDGHTWSFAPFGPRRTQSLLGDVTTTAPFHWDGDQKSMSVLMNEVFARRMGNDQLTASEIDAFTGWLSALRDLPVSVTSDFAGRQEFVKAGCDSCHSGARFTNGKSANVGTGGEFQVPSLVGMRYRTPLLHDGCATTIEERFGPCGGDDHGDADKLDDEEMANLLAYLRSI